MKSSKALLGTLLCAFTVVTLAAEPGQPAEREKAVMLYFTKTFGSDQKQNRAPLAFGLKLQQSSVFDTAHSMSLFDARYSLGGHRSFAIAGLNAFESSGESSESSQGPSWASFRKRPYVTGLLIGVSLIGISCGTKNWPCKSNSRYTEPELETPNTPGT